MTKFSGKSKSRAVKLGAAAVSIVLACSMSVATLSASAFTASGVKGDYYTSFGSKSDVVKAGNALNEEISEEGFVLMKNNGVLPLAASIQQGWSKRQTKVSVFGKASTNLLIGGSGSGSGNTAGAATIKDSLELAGYDVNDTLWNWYSGDVSGANSYTRISGDQVTHGLATIETTTAAFNEGKATFEGSLSDYSDAAVVVFARQGGEGIDLPTSSVDGITLPENAEVGDELTLSENGNKTLKGRTGEGRYLDHYLELDEDEEALLDYVESKFDKVIVVINSSNAMEMTELQNDANVDGIVWVGGPGNQGINALGRLLSGAVNFSGRTVDLYASDYSKIPAMANFADQHTIGDDTIAYYVPADNEDGGQWVYGNVYLNEDGSIYYLNDGTGFGLSRTNSGLASHGNVYCKVEYEEDIFVGYRYYDKKKTEVLYPFGHGLSYTEFVYSDLELSAEEISDEETLTVRMTVKNVGTYRGKEAIQLYVGEDHPKIIRPVKELRAFCKTELQPGESKPVEFVLDRRAFAYYDEKAHDFLVPPGEYTIFIGSSSRDLRLTGKVLVRPSHFAPMTVTPHTSLCDLRDHPATRGFVEDMLAKASAARHGGKQPAETDYGMGEGAKAMIDAMIDEMTLCTIAGYMGLGDEQLNGLIAMLQGMIDGTTPPRFQNQE